jgi:hypothetical protein
MKHNAWKIFLSKLTVILIVGTGLLSICSVEVLSQKRRTTSQKRGTTARAGGKVYNNFVHNISAHRQSCTSCHKSPTGFSSAETLTGEDYKYPDITDYPDHDACISCHRQQFFKGPRPAICSICHTKVSPRDKARFAFPQTGKVGEFATRFPHDVHQDIIAGIENPSPRSNGIAAAHFVNAGFSLPASVQDDKKTDFNNCTICHAPAAGRVYNTVSRRPQLVALETGMVTPSHREKITAPAGYFKTLPSGHDSCFNCHYTEQQPTRNNCAGCHIQQGSNVAQSSVIERFSLKFNHNETKEDGSNVHDLECATCHVRITQSAELRTLDPDVPIFTCGGSCHGAKIKMEVTERADALEEKKKNPQLEIKSCSYCHNTFIGSYQVPKSHLEVK